MIMANNMFIGYDLMRAGQNYQAVSDAIESLGPCAQMPQPFFYVSTELSQEQVTNRVLTTMDSYDSLIVIKAMTAQWFNLPHETSRLMNQHWF
jgi:hypothetical protein